MAHCMSVKEGGGMGGGERERREEGTQRETFLHEGVFRATSGHRYSCSRFFVVVWNVLSH